MEFVLKASYIDELDKNLTNKRKFIMNQGWGKTNMIKDNTFNNSYEADYLRGLIVCNEVEVEELKAMIKTTSSIIKMLQQNFEDIVEAFEELEENVLETNNVLESLAREKEI